MNKKVLVVFCFLTSWVVFNVQASFDNWHGFFEFDYGVKLNDDSTKRDAFNILEQRLQLKNSYFFQGDNYLAKKNAFVNFRGDFTVDEYFSGKTDFELRELNLSFVPFDIADVKIGRQILTWGTGDYIFINDLFPKDYQSFFLGRDDEYLKKPSDALKISLYPGIFNLDFIVIAPFTPNTIAKGDRLSFFDSFQGGISGIDSDRDLVEPSRQFVNNEYALRIYKNIGSNELAVYFFRGFDKNPRSYKDEANRELFYQRLDVYGLSLRGPFCSGIGNLEFGYYNSVQDSSGDNRLIENSMFKALVGYSKDLGNDLKVGFQYLYEQKLDYDNYWDNLLSQDYFWDEFRHVLTNRITKLFKNQTVMLNIFSFYSPSDRDGYIRPSISYDINDFWKVTLGANIIWGKSGITEFGQMRSNNNIFLRARYSF